MAGSHRGGSEAFRLACNQFHLKLLCATHPDLSSRRPLMADLFENPAGLDGFEFLEFSGSDRAYLDKIFRQLSFPPIARLRSQDVAIYRQCGINFLLTA